MAPIFKYFCTTCDFEPQGGFSCDPYALNEAGKKVYFGDDILNQCTVPPITGMSYQESIDNGLIGCDYHCICFSCLHEFDLDLRRDVKKCSKCGSLDVKSSTGSLGEQCPKCKKGIISGEIEAIT